MSNYAWLCNYGSYAVANTYGMLIQTDDYDGSERFFLEKKKKASIISDDELLRLNYIKNIHINLNDIWHNRNFWENLPIKLLKEPDIDYNNMPNKDDVFFVINNGYLIFSKELYDIISKFNLGKTHFSQVYIYDIETKEQLSDTPYYFINIAEKFEFLDIENSQEISVNQYFPEQRKRWIGEPKNDDIKLLVDCDDFSIDLWHDSLINNSLFFSDRLTNALFQSGFTKEQLGLIRCVIQ